MNVVAHNLQAMNTSRQLGIINTRKSKSTEKLASGYKINKAADDAAGLTISEKLRWQTKGLNKASVNCQDGASLIQVAEGALNEVHSILNRLKELSVQAANDTNTTSDRDHIQDEMDELIKEVNHISDTTMFNTMPLFKGSEKPVIDENTGRPVDFQQIPISDFEVSDVEIGKQPFLANSTHDTLALSATLKGNYNVSGTTWGLIFGNGSTSHSNFRYSYTDAQGVKKNGSAYLNQMSKTTEIDSAQGKYKRTFSYSGNDGVAFDIIQSITVDQNNGESQYYNFEYSVKNTGSVDIEYELLHNEDTAYNNNDGCEEYYTNGNKLNNFTLFTQNPKYLGSVRTGVDSDLNKAMNFSIYNASQFRLPFSENISVESKNLTSVLIGNWGTDTSLWSNIDTFGAGIGTPTDGRDKAFSLIWSGSVNQGVTDGGMKFKQGIVSAKTDNNVKDVPVTNDPSSMKLHMPNKELWIQSGATDKSGFFINVGEMNSTVLGLDNLSVMSFREASMANASVDKAIDMLSLQRSDLGAQMNRLEKAVLVDDNTAENTQAAESRIRDTDMAGEMVAHSAASIIEQAGQAMLAQANQSTQGVLSLLM